MATISIIVPCPVCDQETGADEVQVLSRSLTQHGFSVDIACSHCRSVIRVCGELGVKLISPPEPKAK